MSEEKLEKLLNELAEKTAEPVNPGIAEQIKRRIPQRLVSHNIGSPINVIIDLRVSKLAAAAVIIITMILMANFFGGRSQDSTSMYDNGKLILKYLVGSKDAERGDIAVGMSKYYEELTNRGIEAAYYGDVIDMKDSNSVLMQWKLPDGEYRVIFSDLRPQTVSAEKLIKLQSQMLQKKTK